HEFAVMVNVAFDATCASTSFGFVTFHTNSDFGQQNVGGGFADAFVFLFALFALIVFGSILVNSDIGAAAGAFVAGDATCNAVGLVIEFGVPEPAIGNGRGFDDNVGDGLVIPNGFAAKSI